MGAAFFSETCEAVVVAEAAYVETLGFLSYWKCARKLLELWLSESQGGIQTEDDKTCLALLKETLRVLGFSREWNSDRILGAARKRFNIMYRRDMTVRCMIKVNSAGNFRFSSRKAIK